MCSEVRRFQNGRPRPARGADGLAIPKLAARPFHHNLVQRALALFLISLFVMPGAFARGEETVDKADYLAAIKPLLAQRCTACHGALKHESGLRLDAAVFIRKGGDRGTAITTGNSAESLIIQAVSGADEDLRMPPDGAPLKEAEIALLKAWIDSGASAPDDEEIPPDPREHWSFKRPMRPDVPQPANAGWVINPIDAFVSAAHDQHGLTPAREAQKHVLLRRVYLDLIGLPPTPEQLRAFLADESKDAYAKVVAQLLDSPRYGERWGRHWMDVWRYSDWYGYKAELRNSARHIWRWRDWIVESLNADAGYDNMIVDMLAADELDPTNRDSLRATGFLARHYYKFNRNVWLDSTVEHTSKAFMAVTMNCARCHDHMFDPIAQREYYQYRAIFEPYKVRTDRLPGEPNVKKNGLTLAFDASPTTPTYVFNRGNDRRPDKENPVDPGVPDLFDDIAFDVSAVKLPASVYYPGLRPYVRKETRTAARKKLAGSRKQFEKAEQTLIATRKEREQLRVAASESEKPAAATSGDALASTPSGDDAFLHDDFSTEKLDVWEPVAGAWEYKDGGLLQTEVVSEKISLTSLHNHPRDFTVAFRFTIGGGTAYHSVGLSFDVTPGVRGTGVYVSGHQPDPKIQITHGVGGKAQYPAHGRTQLPITVGNEYVLRVDVRDRLINASVDGKRVLAYTIPHERHDGRLSLWTYDSAAKFIEVRLDPLSADAQMVEQIAVGPADPERLTAVDAQFTLAKLAKEAAEKRVVAAVATLSALEARIAADDTRFSSPPAKNADDLALAALVAGQNETFFTCDADVAQSTLELEKAKHASTKGDAKKAKAVAQAEKKLADANAKFEEASKTRTKLTGDYETLTDVHPAESTGRRLALARWIASDENPLTARVAINHMWMRHFGKPLVPTVFDFGLNGKPSSHPELLDWLAVEFMENDWRMKHVHRLIVMSNVYRMASSSQPKIDRRENETADTNNSKIDPDNIYLWRSAARRMESEVVRDSILHVSGELDLTTGGPEIDAKQGLSTHRRSIYYRHAPEKLMTFLEVFDTASTTECYRRHETVVPQQALAMINSRLAIEQARILAGKINKQVGAAASSETTAAFINALFELILCREPLDEERKTCESFLTDQTARLTDTSQLTRFDSGPELSVLPSPDPGTRARENLVHVMLNHNEFVTVR